MQRIQSQKLCVCVFKMEEEEGFEPPRGLTRLSVFKTDPFSQTWVFLRSTRINLSWIKMKVNIFYRFFLFLLLLSDLL